jgi:hypothetical protein
MEVIMYILEKFKFTWLIYSKKRFLGKLQKTFFSDSNENTNAYSMM